MAAPASDRPRGGGALPRRRRADLGPRHLQAGDPEALAARWADIAEIPVGRDRHGHPTLALQNAELRFVPCVDGRPEGLAGLDIHAVDQARVLAVAEARGIPRTGDTIELVGMRIRLV